MSDTDPYKENKREMSGFICEELLYDYVSGTLEGDRLHSVEVFLEKDKEVQKTLTQVEGSLQYLEALSKTQVARDKVESLVNIRSIYSLALEKIKWNSWPEFFKWIIQGVSISMVAALVGVMIPWSQIADWLSFEKPVVIDVLPQTFEPKNTVEKTATHLEPPATSLVTETSTQQKSVKVIEGHEPEAATKPKVFGEKVKPKMAPKGIIYRGFMDIEGLDVVTPLIVSEIEELGGSKAGRVDLGWRKPDESYFHISLPESRYKEFLEALRHFGPVRIYKSLHNRVMPEGQIRIILRVKEKTVE